MAKKDNGEGSTRRLDDGSWECIVQSKYLNPDTNTKRIKRKGKTEKEAQKMPAPLYLYGKRELKQA